MKLYKIDWFALVIGILFIAFGMFVLGLGITEQTVPTWEYGAVCLLVIMLGGVTFISVSINRVRKQ